MQRARWAATCGLDAWGGRAPGRSRRREPRSPSLPRAARARRRGWPPRPGERKQLLVLGAELGDGESGGDETPVPRALGRALAPLLAGSRWLLQVADLLVHQPRAGDASCRAVASSARRVGPCEFQLHPLRRPLAAQGGHAGHHRSGLGIEIHDFVVSPGNVPQPGWPPRRPAAGGRPGRSRSGPPPRRSGKPDAPEQPVSVLGEEEGACPGRTSGPCPRR